MSSEIQDETSRTGHLAHSGDRCVHDSGSSVRPWMQSYRVRSISEQAYSPRPPFVGVATTNGCS